MRPDRSARSSFHCRGHSFGKEDEERFQIFWKFYIVSEKVHDGGNGRIRHGSGARQKRLEFAERGPMGAKRSEEAFQSLIPALRLCCRSNTELACRWRLEGGWDDQLGKCVWEEC